MSPNVACMPNGEHVCTWLQNASAASAHALADSPLTLPESPFVVPLSEPPPLPASASAVPAELDEEQPAATRNENTTGTTTSAQT